MNNYNKILFLLIIAMININLSCSFIREEDKLIGWWEDKDAKLFIHFSKDTLHIYDSSDRSHLYPYMDYNNIYSLNNGKIITDRSYEICKDSLKIVIDTMATYKINKYSNLELTFLRNFAPDTSVILKRPTYYKNRKLLKLQFSFLGQYIFTKYPNYDLQIDSSGFVIYHGINNCELQGFYKGFDTSLFNAIETKFQQKSLSQHIDYFFRYRDDHYEPHLVLFWEDTTEYLYLLNRNGQIPIYFDEIFQSLESIEKTISLTEIDTNIYFESHLARLTSYQSQLYYLNKFDSTLFKPIQYTGGNDKFWTDFLKLFNAHEIPQDYSTLQKINDDSSFWLNLTINELGEVVDCQVKYHKLSDQFYVYLMTIFNQMPKWEPAIYNGQNTTIKLDMIYFHDFL